MFNCILVSWFRLKSLHYKFK